MMKQANAAAVYSVLEKMANEAEQTAAADDDQWVTIDGDRGKLQQANIIRTPGKSFLNTFGRAVGFMGLGALAGGLGGAAYDWAVGDSGTGMFLGANGGLTSGALYGLMSAMKNELKYTNDNINKGIQEGYLRIGKDGKLQIRKDLLPA